MGYRAYIRRFKAIGQYFKMGRFGEVLPSGGESGGLSENEQNSSSSNVPENIHTKFQENRTKFPDFWNLGGKSPPEGGGMGGDFRKLEKKFVK